MRWIVDLSYLLACLLYLPVALYNAVFLGKNRTGWGQRLGRVPRFEAGRRRVWMHAVSLGEVNATPRLVETLQQRLTDAEIILSTTTDTGYARAVELYGEHRVLRFPLDFSPVVARVLRRVQPSLIVLVELEVWYNLVRIAARKGIPVAVVNGRLTPRSAKRLRRLGGLVRGMFHDLAWVGAQDEDIARRFRSLGVCESRVAVTSSLKWDSADVRDRVDGTDALAHAVGIDGSHPLWVCGSTGPGEEAIILQAYRQLLQEWAHLAQSVHAGGSQECIGAEPIVAIVPRKPERFDEVARLIERAGMTCVRRSEHRDNTAGKPVIAPAVILGDTMGELRKFYGLADAVLVGRSLVPMGGSDPMEVAAMGKPCVVGPHTDNFVLPVKALRQANALCTVESADTLAPTLARLLVDRPFADALGSRAREVVLANQGATERTAEALVGLLDTG